MPDTPPTTLIHFSLDAQTGGRAVCGTIAPADGELAGITARPGMVTCFACRANSKFKAALRGIGEPTPLPQRQTPTLLRDIIAESTDFRDIVKQGLNAGTNDAEHEALTELADALGLTYDEGTDTYS